MAVNCECSGKLLTKLRDEKNLSLAEWVNGTGFTMGGPDAPFSIPIRTKKNNRFRIQHFFPSFCPICGKKYAIL